MARRNRHATLALLLTSILLTAFAGLWTRYSIALMLMLWPRILWVVLALVPILVLAALNLLPRQRHDPVPTLAEVIVLGLAFLAGTLLIAGAVPALVILWFVKPAYPKRAIQVAVLLLSMGVGIAYYFLNRNKFVTVADRVSYFAGVFLTPVAIVEIIL